MAPWPRMLSSMVSCCRWAHEPIGAHASTNVGIACTMRSNQRTGIQAVGVVTSWKTINQLKAHQIIGSKRKNGKRVKQIGEKKKRCLHQLSCLSSSLQGSIPAQASGRVFASFHAKTSNSSFRSRGTQELFPVAPVTSHFRKPSGTISLRPRKHSSGYISKKLPIGISGSLCSIEKGKTTIEKWCEIWKTDRNGSSLKRLACKTLDICL